MNKNENEKDEYNMQRLTLTGVVFGELVVSILIWQLTDLDKLTDVLNLLVNIAVGGFIAILIYVAIYLIFYYFDVPKSTKKWTVIFFYVVPVALILAGLIAVLV